MNKIDSIRIYCIFKPSSTSNGKWNEQLIIIISVKPRRIGHRQDYAEVNDGEKVSLFTVSNTVVYKYPLGNYLSFW